MIRTGRKGGKLAGLFLLQCQFAGHAGLAPCSWIQINTPNLELLTNAEASVAAEALSELANLRTDWHDVVPESAAAEIPLRIVAFTSDAEFQPFRISAFSPAYFVGGPGQDTIVLDRLTKANFPALRHEFVHHLVRARWRSLPLWLEEGLAEYFGGVESGVAQARARRLRQGGLMVLQELERVTNSSAGYKYREAALQFYAESWALVHLLMSSKAYREGAWALVDRLNGVESLESAVQWVYRRGLWQMQADLAMHLGRLNHGGAAPGRTVRVAAASSAAADEVNLALARLLVRKGDLRAAEHYLGGLTESSRDNPELWSLRASMALREGRPGDARLALQEAFRLGSREARGRRHLAVLGHGARNQSALEPVLARLVEADPASGRFAAGADVAPSHALAARGAL